MKRRFRFLLLCALTVTGCRNDTDARFEIGRATVQHNLPALEEGLSSEDLELRCYAATAISRIRDTKALSLYKRVLKMNDCGWKIPAETVLRIEEINAREGAPAIMELLSSSDIRIQVNTAIALAGLHWTDAIPRLESLTETSENPLAQAWFTWAICSLNQPGQESIDNSGDHASPCVRPKKPSIDD